jgi:endonuclease YncB( thermonuclease family)
MSDNWTPRRRSVLTAAGALVGSTALPTSGSVAGRSGLDADSTAEGTVPPLEFLFPNALLDPEGQPLTDESVIAVEAEPTAEFADAPERWKTGQYDKGYEGDGVWTDYPDDAPIPLVAVDDRLEGTVVGLGSLMVPDGTQWDAGNAEFMLNLWDEYIRGTPGEETVLFHQFSNVAGSRTLTGTSGYNGEGGGGEGQNSPGRNHQYWSLDKFARFRNYSEANGYELVTDSYAEGDSASAGGFDVKVRPDVDAPFGSTFVAALETEQPSAVWLSCPDSFEEPELKALRDYVERGGVVFLHDSSDMVAEEWDRTSGRADGIADDRGGGKEAEPDPSTHLNEIADYLDADFRFNDGIVRDPDHALGGGMGRYVVRTAQFNTERYRALFSDREGIASNNEFYHLRGRVSDPADGDTYDLQLDRWGVKFTTINRPERKREESHSIEVRVLGIDAPEDGDGDEAFERPVEWEGLADGAGSLPLINKLQFDDACSLAAPNGGPLTDDDVVAVSAAETAENTTGDDGGNGIDYADEPIPLVAAGDGVVGIGAAFVDDGADNPDRQGATPSYEFLHNVWDAHLGGGATVLYDEGHGQPLALEDHSEFVDYDDKSIYDVAATTDLTADLPEADAVWLTPPATAFTADELDALAAFVDDGGAVFLHGRSEATGEAFTGRCNDIAEALEAPFRFNSDRVTDPESNGGDPAKPQAPRARFGHRSRFPFFLLRDRANGHSHLEKYSYRSLGYLQQNYVSQDVVFEFDPDGTLFGGLGRIYGQTYLEEDYPEGSTYAAEVLQRGWARVYDSGHSTHDDYLELELEARTNNRGVWTPSDPARSEQIRNRPVDRLYLPQAASVRTEGGALPDDRAPVRAEPTATRADDSSAAGTPLVGLDETNNVALVGSPLLAESYEIRENDYRVLSFTDVEPFWVNTAGYENFTFVTNLLRRLSDRDGSVLIDCGHGQFGGSVDRFGGNYTLSAEDSRYFERHLEGIGVNCEGIHDIAENLNREGFVDAGALVVSTPTRPFTDAELEALRNFQARGGAIVLLGSAEALSEDRARLNEVADAVGTDLRLGDDQVLDEANNLHGMARLPTTGNTNPAFAADGLFDRAETVAWTGPGDGLPAEDDDENLPSMTASGSRSDDGSVFTKGQTNKMDVRITGIADPVQEATVTDSVPDGWTVAGYGDAQNSGDVRTVELGTVTREELEEAEDGLTRTYFVEAEGSTGRYTFGPATATATESEAELESDSAEFGGTDTNTIVGVSSETSG